MPDVELRADYDRDGRLSGSAAEYAARAVGHGAIVGVNADRDGRPLPAVPRIGRPVQLDHTLPTKRGDDREPVTLQVVVSPAAVARFAALALRAVGPNAGAIALIDARSRVVRPAGTAPDRVEFALPLRAGRHAFKLEAARVPGSPLGQLDGALTLSIVGRDTQGRELTVDESRFLLARFLVLDDLAPAQTLYICIVGDNAPSVRDVRAGLAGVRPAVALREVAPADNQDDGWIQDQFQLGYVVAPGRTLRTVLHMPRFRTNAQLGANQRNLAELVRTHFPSTDLGLIDDFWRRTVPIRHSGGVAQLSLADSEAAFRILHGAVAADGSLRDALERLCSAAAQVGISPAPPECSRIPPQMETIPSIRLQLPELSRRVEALARRVLAAAPSSQRPGIETVRDRARRLVSGVERTLGVSGPRGREEFALVLAGSTFRMTAADLIDLFDTIQRMHDSLVYGGNVEASPPLAGHPFGKVVIGEGDDRPLDPAVRDLFDSSAAVQPVVTVDTAWLKVGHVDELMAFVPDRTTRAHAILRASPEVAFALIEKASDLYRSGLRDTHPDAPIPWRPITTGRHRMDRGSHPVTRLFRGKLWLHAHPRPQGSAGAQGGGAGQQEPGVAEELPPPRVYLRMVDWFSGLLSDLLAPFDSDSTQEASYYKAALSAWEFDFFEGNTNQRIVDQKLGTLDALLEEEFRGFPIRRVPVVFDRPAELGRRTAAFTPNLVNLQFVNGTALIPNPYGPRALPADAAQVVADVLREQGLSRFAGRVSTQYFRRQRLDVTEVWMNRASHGGLVASLFGTATDLAAEFADGFPGVRRDEIARRIRRANRRAFDASERLRAGWHKLLIPEHTVDLFQAYTHVVLEAQGVRPHWVDSWFYHVRDGEIHCGTNVLRSVPRVRTPWWTRVPPRPGTPAARSAPTR